MSSWNCRPTREGPRGRYRWQKYQQGEHQQDGLRPGGWYTVRPPLPNHGLDECAAGNRAVMGGTYGIDGGETPTEGTEGGCSAWRGGDWRIRQRGGAADRPHTYQANPMRPPWRKALTLKGSPRHSPMCFWWRCKEINSTTSLGHTWMGVFPKMHFGSVAGGVWPPSWKSGTLRRWGMSVDISRHAWLLNDRGYVIGYGTMIILSSLCMSS